jgi:acyl carrier protein
MNPQEVEEKLAKIFVKVVRIPVPPADQPRREIPLWDSLQHAQLILELQKEFKIRFTTDEILCGDSYATMLKMLQQKLNP